ncbi:MAG: hypothetical protein HY926_10130 [Elusimicrobia bacterium]|nr:hypothetical protein [Elusimicrobiota bacterium]
MSRPRNLSLACLLALAPALCGCGATMQDFGHNLGEAHKASSDMSSTGMGSGLAGGDFNPMNLAIKPAATVMAAGIMTFAVGHRLNAVTRITTLPDPQARIAAWEKEIKSDPSFIDAYYHLASDCQQAGDQAKALESLDQALARPEFPRFTLKELRKPKKRTTSPADVQLLRAMILYQKGEKDRALDALAQAIEFQSGLVAEIDAQKKADFMDFMPRQALGSCHFFRGGLLTAEGRYDEALKDYESVKALYAAQLRGEGPQLKGMMADAMRPIFEQTARQQMSNYHSGRTMLLSLTQRCPEAKAEALEARAYFQDRQEYLAEMDRNAGLAPQAYTPQLMEQIKLYPDKAAPEPEYLRQFAAYQSKTMAGADGKQSPKEREALLACLGR